MKIDGQDFLEELALLPPDTFESHFSKLALSLHLGVLLDRNELKLLCEAALSAELCNLAFNGLDTNGGEIRPEHEARRRQLEEHFMFARDVLWASPGWQTMSDPERESTEQGFLQVLVAEDKLAQ